MTYTPLTEFTIQPSITNMEEAHEYICNAVISLDYALRDDFLMSLHELLINSYRELEQNNIADGDIVIELARSENMVTKIFTITKLDTLIPLV